eukprot:NODE_3612_length_353_cov_57.592105_g3530_i0.p2 GENE.NODE_3612_length_353_cov_57.592105_g3530_i0~~NODE_3612_length_353_cov_57.592105_g3530_i0.p2  ORF type:complete len:56 (-),score=1.24 NODE_3612_length_353_cov_57.592105_g3530_i0:47-214(-)
MVGMDDGGWMDPLHPSIHPSHPFIHPSINPLAIHPFHLSIHLSTIYWSNHSSIRA